MSGASAQAAELALDQREVRAFASRFLGRPVTLRALSGERDLNFRVRDAHGREFVLKLSQAAGEAPQAEFEAAALEHLARVAPEVPTPRVVRSAADGAAVLSYTPGFTGRGQATRGSAGPARPARMVTYLDGTPLGERAASDALLCEIGDTLARIDLAYAGWGARVPARELAWDLRTVPRIHALIGTLPNVTRAQRELVQRAARRYEAGAAAALAKLPTQVIHNDANPYNVLVAGDGRLAGLIDFGDLVCAPAIQELGTACAYHVPDRRKRGEPLAAAALITSAYHARRPLSEAELEILPVLIGARAILSVVISAHSAVREPHHSAYLLRNAGPAWECLRALDHIDPAQAASCLRPRAEARSAEARSAEPRPDKQGESPHERT